MLELQHGRPVDCTGRLEKEIRTYNLLDRLNIEYDRVDHKALDTMEDCAEVDKLFNALICKNLFLCNSQKTRFYLLMMPGDKKFHTKDLSAQINSARLSFAGEEYMEKFLDITPGSVSVMGLMNDKEGNVQLLMDEEVLQGEYLGCHPCINTSSIRLKISDVVNVFLPEVGHRPVMVHLERY
ncbi:MAG: prolyl-tRNA synthetase associated domain-containing protein [Lachnospiraceae bacterium]